VDENVRSARGCAVATLIAGVGNPDSEWRELVRETKKSAVRTGVGAESLRSKEINGDESADDKKRDGDWDGRKSLPKISGDKMVGKFRDKWPRP
jgi:hypothetical protein